MAVTLPVSQTFRFTGHFTSLSRYLSATALPTDWMRNDRANVFAQLSLSRAGLDDDSPWNVAMQFTNSGRLIRTLEEATLAVEDTDGEPVYFRIPRFGSASPRYTGQITAAEYAEIRKDSNQLRVRFVPEAKDLDIPPINVGLSLPKPYGSGILLSPRETKIGTALGRPAPVADVRPRALGVGLALPKPKSDNTLGVAGSIKAGVAVAQPKPRIRARPHPIGIGVELGMPISGRAVPRELKIGIALGKAKSDNTFAVPEDINAGLALSDALGRVWVSVPPIGIGVKPARPIPLADVRPSEMRIGFALPKPAGIFPGRPFPITFGVAHGRPQALQPFVPETLGIGLILGMPSTADDWPQGVPQYFSARGFNAEIIDTLRRSPVDQGNDLIHRRYSAGAVRYSGSIVMSDAEWARFQSWWYSVNTSAGARHFLFQDPFDNGNTILVQALAQPQRTREGGHWRVSLQLRESL